MKTKRQVSQNISVYFEEILKCTRTNCGASFKRMDADFRDVPVEPIDGIPTFQLIPSCPACHKPLLFDYLATLTPKPEKTR